MKGIFSFGNKKLHTIYNEQNIVLLYQNFINRGMEFGVLIIGILAGVFSGLFGIGGGIIMVPTLIVIFGMDMLDANATSLAAMLLPVGVFGVINYYKAGYVNIKDSLWISLGLLFGSFFGAEVAVSIQASLLSKLYAAYILYVAIGYLNIPSYFSKAKKEELSSPSSGVEKPAIPVWKFIAVGLLAGVVAGMFGKGGGLIIVPLLISYFGYNPKSATATSLAALQLPVGLPSVIVYAQQGHLNYLFAGLMALGILSGVFFGSKLALKLPNSIFKKVYALFLIGVAIFMIYKYF
jgi:uncharacterized protein